MKGSRLGQHFLVNRSAAAKIVRAFLPEEGYILEIGPGNGILTDLLIQYRRHDDLPLTAVELDPDLCRELKDRYSEGLNIINQDILSIPLENHFPDSAISLIGNLPYYISKEIIEWIIRYHAHIRKGVVMLQREFVDKLHGRPPNPQALVFRYLFDTETLFDVSPGSFSPLPRIKSTVFRFQHKFTPPEPSIDIPALYIFLKKCFIHRRKTILNNLLPHYPAEDVHTALRHCRIPPHTRPEALKLKDFLCVFPALK